MCLGRARGELLWKRTLQPGWIERGAHLSNPATSTPATDGATVYVYFGSFGLAAYDFEGNERWVKSIPPPVTQHGPGTSPVVADGRLFLVCDQDTESFLECFDAKSGVSLWKTKRPGFKRGFSTPLLYPAEFPEQVILPGSLRMTSYDVRDGKERWSVGGLPNEMVASAIAGDGLIFVAGWAAGSGVRAMPGFDDLLRSDADHNGTLTRAELPSGPGKQHFVYLDANKDGQLTREEYEQTAGLFDKSQNAAMAIQPDGSGEVSETRVCWKFTRGLPNCPTPIYFEKRLFFVRNGGLATCLDALTGKPFYQEERLGALGDYYASPVAADGKICVISQSGVSTVIQAGETLEVLARNELKESVIATPAIADNKIFVRTTTQMYAFGEQQKLQER